MLWHSAALIFQPHPCGFPSSFQEHFITRTSHPQLLCKGLIQSQVEPFATLSRSDSLNPEISDYHHLLQPFLGGDNVVALMFYRTPNEGQVLIKRMLTIINTVHITVCFLCCERHSYHSNYGFSIGVCSFLLFQFYKKKKSLRSSCLFFKSKNLQPNLNSVFLAM